jgi:hypothetical protein
MSSIINRMFLPPQIHPIKDGCFSLIAKNHQIAAGIICSIRNRTTLAPQIHPIKDGCFF